jgi:hypothetical protein
MSTMTRTEWARPREVEVYHSVTFQPGPNIHEAPAACGLVAHFWPRIGVRMNDTYCRDCWQIVVAADEAGLTI